MVEKPCSIKTRISKHLGEIKMSNQNPRLEWYSVLQCEDEMRGITKMLLKEDDASERAKAKIFPFKIFFIFFFDNFRSGVNLIKLLGAYLGA